MVMKYVYFIISIQPLELNVSMEEPSTSGVYVPLTYTAEPSNAAKATSMSHGMCFCLSFEIELINGTHF